MLKVLFENGLNAARRASKLILWLQFLRHGLVRFLWRYYAGPWLAALAVLALSAAMLLAAAAPGDTARLVFVACCPLLVMGGYLLGRFVPLLVAAVAIVVPGTMTITPTVSRTSISIFAADENQLSNYLGTGDLALFLRGAGVCLFLSAISFLFQILTRLPRTRRWPLRWAITVTILASSLPALELLRLSLGLAPYLRAPWAGPLMTMMREPGWPSAIAFWLWANTVYLLARYDAKLIPYLLRRSGTLWAPGELSIHETYLVDHLLRELASAPPASTGDKARGKSRKSGRAERRRPPSRNR